jgi:imidazolonepropionase-like amidohydrolase
LHRSSDRCRAIRRREHADLVAVSENPLGDITEIQRVKLVMQRGKVIRDELTRVAAGAGSR